MRKIALLSALAAGCSSTTLPPSDVLFLPGQETDLWTKDPVPSKVAVDLVINGQHTPLGDGPAPTSGLSIGNREVGYGSFATFEATATDGTGSVVASGSSVTFLLDGIEAIDVPLFVGRTGGWSRPPDTLEHAHRHAVACTALHEFVIATGGDTLAGVDGSIPDFYDLAQWTTLRSQPAFPRAAKSAGVVDPQILLIDSTAASWLDLSTDAVTAATAPEGLSYAEIAGGDTIALADGTLFIVGATRAAGDPTTKVLQVAPDRTLTALALTTPRLGAGAGIVGGKLVVAGGAATGAGIEVLNDMHTAFVALGAPADPTVGLGVGELDGTTLLLGGGKDPTTGAGAPLRTLDTACGATCAPSALGALPTALTLAHVFRIDTGKLVVAGESDDGETHTFSVHTGGAMPDVAELPLRERRKGASPLLLPNGQLGLVGGLTVDGKDAPVSSIEALFP
jgi:hypothetical protein